VGSDERLPLADQPIGHLSSEKISQLSSSKIARLPDAPTKEMC
jgi:hypothetical protein